MAEPVGVGLIGAGSVSDQYLANLSAYPDVRVVAIGNRDTSRAARQAERYGVARFGDAGSVLDNPGVEIVVNLTTPAVHVEVSAAALESGKHVWSEKPIGLDRRTAWSLVELAKERRLLLGVAPDTVLGPMWQTAKRIIQSGGIGTPLSVVTSFQSQGPDLYHQNPAFLFAKGGGPLFDIGPYYLAAMVHLLGPIARVVAIGTTADAIRTVKVGPLTGTTFPVEVPTHLAVASVFRAGQTASSLMSVDTPLWRRGIFEVNGTEATLVIGDPDHHSGSGLRLYRPFAAMPTTERFSQVPEKIAETGSVTGRGVGVLAMARTIRGDDLHIATGEMGYHVLDAMLAIEESAATAAFVELESTVAPVRALPEDFDPYLATL